MPIGLQRTRDDTLANEAANFVSSAVALYIRNNLPAMLDATVLEISADVNELVASIIRLAIGGVPPGTALGAVAAGAVPQPQLQTADSILERLAAGTGPAAPPAGGVPPAASWHRAGCRGCWRHASCGPACSRQQAQAAPGAEAWTSALYECELHWQYWVCFCQNHSDSLPLSSSLRF
jgi:hypothetical protein